MFVETHLDLYKFGSNELPIDRTAAVIRLTFLRYFLAHISKRLLSVVVVVAIFIPGLLAPHTYTIGLTGLYQRDAWPPHGMLDLSLGCVIVCVCFVRWLSS